MTKMDDVPQYECDLFVEDTKAQALLVEILVAHKPDLVQRCRAIPYGASSVGQALGQMIVGRRFPRPSCVFLDGDEGTAPGCINLPGDDAPERVVFEALKSRAWLKVADRTGRAYAQVVDACVQAMALTDHHDWVDSAATKLVLGGDTLWQALCSEWARECLSPDEAVRIVQPIEDALLGVAGSGVHPVPVNAVVGQAPERPASRTRLRSAASSNDQTKLFDQ
jgi:hypothetical protein